MENKLFENTVREFHDTIIDLIKKYQFRDRNEMTCYGISVSQCYTLEAIYSKGPMNMKDLACRMRLAISTITRVVDQLENKKLVKRITNAADQREKHILLTKQGKEVFKKSWSRVFESEKKIFEKINPAHRSALIGLLKELNKSVDIWQKSCGK